MAAEDYISIGDYIEEDEFEDDRAEEPQLRVIEGIVAETPKAWLVTISGAQHWMPKSKCKIVQCIEAPTWLVDEKGI